jgi:hypothetical protein
LLCLLGNPKAKCDHQGDAEGRRDVVGCDHGSLRTSEGLILDSFTFLDPNKEEPEWQES